MGLLSSGMYSVTFDAASVARLARLVNAAPVFMAYYSRAMAACVSQVTSEAKQNTSSESVGGFMNPTGHLMNAIGGQVQSPWQGVVGVGPEIPYARRRELGFSGMTDALGRFYPDDSGIYYLERALEDSRPFIGAAFRTATQVAIRDLIL